MIQHFEHFDKPINAKQFRDFVKNKGFYSYHPAGYGGIAKIVTKITKQDNDIIYDCYIPKLEESSTMWVWEHADTCD